MELPRFAVVDVETTGLRPRRDKVLQIGVVTVTFDGDGDGTVSDRWSTLVRLRWPWSRVGPTHIHGIDRRTARTGVKADEALAALAERLRGTVFTAHNAAFDAAFLQRAARRHGVALPIERQLCTLELSRRLDPDRLLSHRLGDLCARYDIDLVRPHDALADADATAAVLPHLLRAYRVATAADLDTLYFDPAPARTARHARPGTDPGTTSAHGAGRCGT